MLILTVIQGPDKGKAYQLPDHEPQLVGRSSEALPISDTTVSRRHAELTPDDGRWHISDLGSQNGTWVNGVRIEERTRLKLGDQIRTGATLFVFGKSAPGELGGVIRVVRPEMMESAIDKAIPSSDDSILMAEPAEPRSAAVHHLRVIYQLTTLTSQVHDEGELLRAVMDLVFAEFKPERGFIVLGAGLAGGSGRRPAPAVVKYATPPAGKDDARIHVSKTIIQHVMRRAEGVLSSNAMHDPRFASGDSVQRLAIRSAICSPVRFRERTYGAIYIDSTLANYTFTPGQLALMNAVGRHAGLALANLDLYAQKLQGERLAAIGETVASLSHSIKNILQGLRGGADVVDMGLKKEDLKVARGGWAILKRNLDRIMALTLNMLAFSRQRTLEPALTSVPALIEDCAGLLHGPAEAKGVAVIVDADPEIPPVALDPNLMHQAVVNLLTNALEAAPARTGVVTVRATYQAAGGRARRGGAGAGAGAGAAAGAGAGAGAGEDEAPGGPGRALVRIAVIDNGPGIPPERHAKVFEPFYTTKGLRGTGLGLAVTRRIVEEHGGRVTLESTGEPARGATFTMVLPAETALTIDPSATADSRAREEGRGAGL